MYFYAAVWPSLHMRACFSATRCCTVRVVPAYFAGFRQPYYKEHRLFGPYAVLLVPLGLFSLHTHCIHWMSCRANRLQFFQLAWLCKVALSVSHAWMLMSALFTQPIPAWPGSCPICMRPQCCALCLYDIDQFREPC